MSRLFFVIVFLMPLAQLTQALSDPTRPLTYSAKSTRAEVSLSLQAVFIGKSASSAIINGKSLNVGERVSGWQLHSIYQDRVVVHMDDKKNVLYLRQSVSKKIGL